MVIGIILGVAVVVAVDLANASASRAFDLSTETVAGKATHQITGGPQGLDGDLFARLLRERIIGSSHNIHSAAAPVISEYVSSPQLGGLPLQLLGIDPFSEAPFRDYLGKREGNARSARPAPVTGDLTTFLTQPGAVLLSTSLAGRYGLRPCPQGPEGSGQAACRIILDVGGRQVEVFLAGELQPVDNLSRRALEGIILTDIATAQELTGRLGKLDRIDLILPDNDPALPARIQEVLPAGARLQTVAARTGAVAQMTSAFRVNLTALSLLALVVGMFLIYNTMTFSVVQRRPMFGTLRCLGVTRKEIFLMVCLETLLLGVLGSILGVALGIFLGQGAVRLVTQTINDLFFVVTVRGVQVPVGSLVKGGLVGVVATLVSAAPPALEAASVAPRTALSRSSLEHTARRAVRWAAAGGVILLVLGVVALALPGRSLVTSFSGTFAVIIGFAMLAPITTGWMMQAMVAPAGKLWGTLGRMAPRNVVNSLSRTSVAVSALMVAISVTIGVSLMVSSFRYTVVEWLSQTLQGDVYLSVPGIIETTSSVAIQPEVVDTVRNWPEVERADVLRSADVDSPSGPVHLAATDNSTVGAERIFLKLDGPEATIWERMKQGGVLVSEPLANRLSIPRQGGVVELYTAQGLRQFPVLGIYYDYASTQGTVLMALPVYRQYWQDTTITAIALRLAEGVDADQVVNGLKQALAGKQSLGIRPNRVLRQEVLAVFDRTFAITGALQLLATVVAFIGVLSALLSLELERQRELGILRAVGLTIRQVWTLVLLETGLLGAVAGFLAMPTGYALALILVFIINRRSFGWTLQMQVQALPFAQALAVAVVAALLAGLYPAYRMGKMATAEALRSE